MTLHQVPNIDLPILEYKNLYIQWTELIGLTYPYNPLL